MPTLSRKKQVCVVFSDPLLRDVEALASVDLLSIADVVRRATAVHAEQRLHEIERWRAKQATTEQTTDYRPAD